MFFESPRRIAETLADHPANDELLAAVVLDADPKKVSAVLQSGETITITGTNDTPTVSSALSENAAEGDASFDVNLLAGASDLDDGENAARF